MAVLQGTIGSDTLIGTNQDDILSPIGSNDPSSPEYLSGLDGADTYSMYRASGTGNFTYVIDDKGTDGAYDTIAGAQSMYQVTDTGVETFASVERVGGDLHIHLPSKAWGYRDPYIAETDITIVDQYGGGQIEAINAGNVTYSLATGDHGTSGADIMGGSVANDRFKSGNGDDWVFGNGGSDVLKLGGGNDFGFGGDADDRIAGHKGNDRLFGEDGNDSMSGGSGDDQIDAGAGNDVVRAGAGNNEVIVGSGADTLIFAFKPGQAAELDVVADFDPAQDVMDFSRTGAQYSDLTIGSSATTGDATVTWDDGTGAGPDIVVELTGINEAAVTLDMFVFV